MVLTRKFQNPPTTIASLDFEEIASGTGNVNFFGAQVKMSGSAVGPFLTSDEGTYSGFVVSGAVRNGSETEISDHDYDVQFNLPVTIDGKIRVSITQGVKWGGAGTTTMYLVFNLYHFDGTTETQIGAVNVETERTTLASGSFKSETKLIEFDTGGRILFGVGDKLRLNIKHNAGGANVDAASGYGIDPKDRDDDGTSLDTTLQVIDDSDTTQLKLSVPFILDI